MMMRLISLVCVHFFLFFCSFSSSLLDFLFGHSSSFLWKVFLGLFFVCGCVCEKKIKMKKKRERGVGE